jgi:glycerophosphoryl diester phosphodiesterase
MSAGVDWIQTDFPHEVLRQAIQLQKIPLPVQISFHRGATRLAPENTLAAIRKAEQLGADYIEVDIRASKDGRCFLLHDGRLDRTTSGTGPIRERSAEELHGLDAGSWFGAPYRGLRIPTFEHCLGEIQRGRARLYADAKDIAPEALASSLEKYGLLERSVVYQSPSYLKRLRALNPRVRLLPPLRDPDQLDQLARDLKPYGVDVDWDLLSQQLIDRCHAAGIKVFSDALDNHETLADYANAINWGVDVIQTDHPARVFRAIELAAHKARARKPDSR